MCDYINFKVKCHLNEIETISLIINNNNAFMLLKINQINETSIRVINYYKHFSPQTKIGRVNSASSLLSSDVLLILIRWENLHNTRTRARLRSRHMVTLGNSRNCDNIIFEFII